MQPIERETLRRLAGRWMELACLPVMAERKRLWTALHDLRGERPMVLFESWTLEHYVGEYELACSDPALRGVECFMRRMIRQVEEIGDDLVLEPHWKVYWKIDASDYGVDLQVTHADDAHGGDVAYAYNHPIRTVADIRRLKPRNWQVDRAGTMVQADQLNDLFGDLLPIVLQATGTHVASLTGDLFRLAGNENLMTWTYDQPEALHQIMAYLRDDRLAYYAWLESEELLGLNNNSETSGSGSPGFTTALPQPDYAGRTRLKDLWLWLESQETSIISPAMFSRFFLPYMAEIGQRFGQVYYGCCEPVHDRWERIYTAIPNIRAVSISPWCDMIQMGEKLGKQVVFSRKPKPWLISGETPDWDGLSQDLDATLAAARDCNLEIVYRDVYRISDRERLGKWAAMVRSRIA
jgi:hypothetical protein